MISNDLGLNTRNPRKSGSYVHLHLCCPVFVCLWKLTRSAQTQELINLCGQLEAEGSVLGRVCQLIRAVKTSNTTVVVEDLMNSPLPHDDTSQNPLISCFLDDSNAQTPRLISALVVHRVLNVLRHWVDQHFYDFEWHYDLLTTLETFLETVKGKAMKKCVESIRKAIKRRKNSASTERHVTHEKSPPRILWHIVTEKYEAFDLMTVGD